MKKRYILVVEDNKFQTKIFNEIINDINFKAISLSSGADFINFVKDDKNILNTNKEEIALVLLDFYLEDMNAIQILKELKKLNNQIPIAILSADSDIDNIVETIKLGADKFFIKGQKEELKKLFTYIDNLK